MMNFHQICADEDFDYSAEVQVSRLIDENRSEEDEAQSVFQKEGENKPGILKKLLSTIFSHLRISLLGVKKSMNINQM